MNLKKVILLSGVGLASAAVGVVIPRMMSGGHDAAATSHSEGGHDEHAAKAAAASSGHDKKADAKHAADSHGKADHGKPAGADAKGHGKPEGSTPAHGNGPGFVRFGAIMVNLNEPSMTKFFQVDITMQTDPEYETEVTEALEARRPILNTWLTSHLADKTVDDIRGKVGVNRLRREIQDTFNSLLFSDGHERVTDILFEEYHVQ